MNCHAKDSHRESYYDIPALATDLRFRDSMMLVQRYSLLPFMSPRQFFYPRVVLDFYHTMTSRGVSDQMQLWFSIDGHPGILQASDIIVALGFPVVLANSIDNRQWPQPLPREMISSLSLSILQPDLYFFVGSFLRRCSSGPRTSVQSVPTTALFTVQRIYSRGSVPDIRGVLVQSRRACHDSISTF